MLSHRSRLHTSSREIITARKYNRFTLSEAPDIICYTTQRIWKWKTCVYLRRCKRVLGIIGGCSASGHQVSSNVSLGTAYIIQ